MGTIAEEQNEIRDALEGRSLQSIWRVRASVFNRARRLTTGDEPIDRALAAAYTEITRCADELDYVERMGGTK